MTADIHICKLALSSIGKAAINSFDENTEEARQCKLHYAQRRRVLLSGQYDWAFARRRVALSPVTNDLNQRWLYAYAYPNFALKLIAVEECQGEIVPPPPYEIANGKLYCNVKEAWVRYITDVDDATLYPPTFIEVFWSDLAAAVSYPLTRDRGTREDAVRIAAGIRSAAEASDANNDINIVSQYSEYEEARS